MTYITKNDYRHGTKSYKDVDAAAIDWTQMRNDSIYAFMRDNTGHKDETLGEYIARTGVFY
jgi:murein L,D-transpeptidase YcbB/YkuD